MLLLVALASIAAYLVSASRPMQLTLVFHPIVGREVWSWDVGYKFDRDDARRLADNYAA